jgi:hypothetical protein
VSGLPLCQSVEILKRLTPRTSHSLAATPVRTLP